ncbi:MAG: hypothetical protein OHK0013_01250 [Sandaracinaceae bacterium]
MSPQPHGDFLTRIRKIGTQVGEALVPELAREPRRSERSMRWAIRRNGPPIAVRDRGTACQLPADGGSSIECARPVRSWSMRHLGLSIGLSIPVLGVALLAGGCDDGPVGMGRDAGGTGRDGEVPFDDGGIPGVAEGVYSVEDYFGVEHPEQILTFPLRGPRREGARYTVLDEDGRAVPHQWLRDGSFAVHLDGGLAAYERRTWTVTVDGAEPSLDASRTVRVTESDDTIVLDNGIVAVRLPSFPDAPAVAPAPIQAVRLRDGSWVEIGARSSLVVKGTDEPVAVRDASVDVVERGPLRAVVTIRYDVDRSGIDGVVEAGVGFHSTTVMLEAFAPTILVEHDSDVDASFLLDWSAGFVPDEARFQGHGVSADVHGRRADGSPYPPAHDRDNEDAVVSLPLRDSPANPFGRYLPRWDPWVDDNGWYWQFYRREGEDASPMVGLFAGPASRVVGAQYSGVLIDAQDPGVLRLRVDTERGRPPARVWPRNRFSWGLFLGTNADLAPTTEPQPIARAMSALGGIHLGKLARVDWDAPLFAGEPNGLYVPRAVLGEMIGRLRSEGVGGPYFEELQAADPALVDLWRAWADTSGDAARALADAVVERAREMLDAFVNGPGIYDFHHHYWMGGLVAERDAVVMNGLMVLASIDPSILADEQRRRLERVALLYAHILWDDDFVPLHGGHGLNLGTPNMPVMQTGFRQTYALWLAAHPTMRERARAVRREVSGLLEAVVNENGASIGSSGYILASLVPIVNTMQQLQVVEDDDPFASEPRIARAADYYLQLLTPPEARFGGRRKAVSFGDGNTMSTELWGQLGTALRDVDTDLSERLMEGWRQAGSAHSFFYGSSVLKIDERLPGREPMLEDADFPGALTVLRDGWSTTDESAAWLLNGTWYRDHYHCDLGAVMYYGGGAPIALHFGSGYSPRMPGAWMQNVVVPEAALDAAWDGDVVSTDGCFGNREGQTVRAAGLMRGADWAAAFGEFVGSDMVWRRRVISYRGDSPSVLRIRDDFEADGAAAKIASLSLMAEGAVDTPAGPFTPRRGSEDAPSSGPVITLDPGVQRFGFRGQWGVDFDVFVHVPPMGGEALIGEWGHTTHPTREMNEFRDATGRTFEERQYILRLRSSGPFDVIIVPYRAGARPADLSLTASGGTLRLTRGGHTRDLVLP